jgi:hypothetical protein
MNRKYSHFFLSARLLSTLLFLSLPALAQAPVPPPANTTPLEALIAQAAGPTSFGNSQRLIAAYLATERQVLQAAADQARQGSGTNQQHGATAEASGTTTLVEKPGIAELLNLAIESGAIVKTTSGTSFTLQTTPYLFYSRFGVRDTAETWDSLPALRRIGLAATFNQGASDAEATRNNFEKGEIKFTWGERSPRDKTFRDLLRPIMEGAINVPVGEATQQLGEFVNNLTAPAQAAFLSAQEQFDKWWAIQPKPIKSDVLKAKLQMVVAPVLPQLRKEDLAALARLMRTLGNEEKALADASQRIDEEAKAYLNAPHPQFSITYSLLRDPMSSTSNTDLSEVKAILGYAAGAKLSFNLNAEVMLNNNQTTADGNRLDHVRSYSAAGDLTFGKFADGATDFTMAVKVTRPEGGSHQMASAQVKLNLYLARGITVPLALSYSNRTENSPKSVIHFNVGLSALADTLLGMAKNNS